MLDATHSLGARKPRRRPAEYRLYYAIIFAAALPIALIGRLFPRDLEGAEAAGVSVLGEARALTNTVIPYLFMG